MRSKKNSTVSLPNNCSFIWYNVLLISVLTISIIFSIINEVFGIVSWPENYTDVIGVSSQIITTIISTIISIIGIAISLQNEEYFDVKITKLYALRKEKHYSTLQIIVISILLSTLNLLFYMLNLTFAAIGTLLVAVLFSIKVTLMEVPLMAKEENAILNIIKSNLIFCYKNKAEATKDLKDAVKYLLYNKNLAEIYELFKNDNDEEFNNFLLLKLLEYQHDLAFELKDITDEGKLRKISHSLLENVFDVVFKHFNFSNGTYMEVVKNKYLLTRVLFRIHEIPATQSLVLGKMPGLFQCLTFSSASSKYDNNLLSSIIIILVAETIKNYDFSIIKTIRKHLSHSNWGIRDVSPALNVFSVLSMYLFYLCHSEPDVPNELKNKIIDFINEGGIIEDNTKIVSWKKLFNTASIKFAVDYNQFIELSLKNSDVLEYWLHSNSAKYLILDAGYLSNWYLTHLINSDRIRSFDYSSFLEQNINAKYHLCSFGEKCFDDNKNFVPTENMKKIVNFYKDNSKSFVLFDIIENSTHKFFNFINTIKIEELKNDVQQAVQIDSKLFSERIKDKIMETIKKEWGYDTTLPINNPERSFSMFFEKLPEAINFEESIFNFCIESVLQDISQSCISSKIYNDSKFEDKIQSMLCKNLKYTTASVKNTIPHFYIHKPDLKQLFVNVCNPLIEFESRILGFETLVTEDGFSFNCKIDKVEIRPLTEEELSKEVDNYRRSDGQYIFRGAFLPQEEIVKIIQDKFAVLTVIIRHQVNSSESSVFELITYSDKAND